MAQSKWHGARRATSGCGLPQQLCYGRRSARSGVVRDNPSRTGGVPAAADRRSPAAFAGHLVMERAVLTSPGVMARYLPAALLAAMAVVQIVLAFTLHLSAWKGGGFGMFATLDHGAFRGVDVVVDAPERSEQVEIAPSLQSEAARAVAFPVDWLLRDLASGIAERERRQNRPVTRVTLSVWRAEFDRASLRGSEQPIRTFVYDVPSEHPPR